MISLAMVAGCYSPQITSGGFACLATDDPPCPQGFHCVNGLCLDHPGAAGSSDDLGGTGGNGNFDFSGTAPPDLSSTDMSKAPGDMSKAPGDMATSTQCGASGDACSADSDCCSGACFLVICF